MNILWLAPIPYNNSEAHPAPWITSLAEHLSKRGISITVVTISKRLNKDVIVTHCENFELHVINCPSGYMDVFTLFKKRLNIISKYVSSIAHKYDLIHVHGTESQFASAINQLENTAIPLIISVQGLIHIYKKYISDFISIRRVMWEIGSVYEINELKRGNYFFCRTHWDSDIVLKKNPNAVIFPVWETLRTEFYENEVSEPGKNILFSGGSNSVKGLSRCLLVLNKILNTNNNVKLHVIGLCSWRYIEKQKAKYSLTNISEKNIILHQNVSALKIIEIYSDCFCLYHPSLIDNSPNSVCEAQLAGLPVIAKNTGGVSSLIEDNCTGFLIEEDLDVDYSRLTSLMNDKILWQRISSKAKRLAQERHNVDDIVDQVIKAYKHIALT